MKILIILDNSLLSILIILLLLTLLLLLLLLFLVGEYFLVYIFLKNEIDTGFFVFVIVTFYADILIGEIIFWRGLLGI